MAWKATQIDQPPTSGSMPERHFAIEHPERPDWLWFVFMSDDGDEWAGAFRQGFNSLWSAIVSGDDHHFYVLSGGVAYCLDADVRDVTAILRGLYTSVIAIPGTSDAAFADSNDVTIAGPSGLIWRTGRLAWDGVRFVSATPSRVTGVAETGHGPADDRTFQIDLVTRSFTGGYTKDFPPE